MVIRTPDVDEVVEPASQLVRVVREIVEQVGRRTVALHEHAVALIPELLGEEPGRSVALLGQSRGGESFEGRVDFAALVEGALGEPGVEVHSDAREIAFELADRVGEAPLTCPLGRHVVAELGSHAFGHLDEVLTLVPALRQLRTPGPRQEGRAEGVELGARVVEVVLAVDLGALGRQHVGDRVADRHPAAAAGVQRSGRVGRHELEVDPTPRQGMTAAVPLARGDHRAQDVVQPGRMQEEVDEARACDLDAFHVCLRRGLERGDDPPRDLPRRRGDRLGELQRDVGLPVAVLALLRRLELHTARRHGQAGRDESGPHGSDQIVDDHEGLGIGETPPNARDAGGFGGRAAGVGKGLKGRRRHVVVRDRGYGTTRRAERQDDQWSASHTTHARRPSDFDHSGCESDHHRLCCE